MKFKLSILNSLLTVGTIFCLNQPSLAATLKPTDIVRESSDVSSTSVANASLLQQDLRDFGPSASFRQGSDGHIIVECKRLGWKDGEALIATWRLRSYNGPLLYVRGTATFSTGEVRALNGSPIGFSVPYWPVASGSEEVYLDSPLSSDWLPGDLFVNISGVVEAGLEGGIILPATAYCQ